MIAEGVKTIGEAAFYQSSLQSISLPDSLETIELEAFRGCAALEEIVIPNGVANIADYAFYACTALKDADLSGAVTVGSSAFYGCTSLQNVVFGDKLQEIAGGAFGNCGLITADFRNLLSLTEIGRSAFNGCESLESVYIGDSVTTLGSQAFGNCPNLQTVEIGSGLQNIGGTTGALASMPVFYNSENVTSVTIDEENKYFSDRGGNCIVYHAPGSSEYRLVQGFVSSTIPAGVTVIGERAFEGVSIAQVTLPDSVIKIEANAFNTNSALTKIDLNNVQTIETGAFGKCSALQEVHVGAALAEIYVVDDYGAKRMAFSDCSALTTITCDENNQTFMANENNSALLSKDGKTLVLGNKTGIVPEGVETIAAYALSNSQLTKVVLPVSLKTVEEFAFSGVRQNLNIFYCGTAWNDVKIDNEKGENNKLKNGTVYYYSETDPGTEGNYWHWVGEPGGEIDVW